MSHRRFRFMLIGALLSAAIFLVGCASGAGATRDNRYQRASVSNEIIVPEEIKLMRDLDLLPLPDFAEEELSNVGKEIIAPEALLAPEVLNQISVQTLGNQSWLIAPQSPSAVWPKLIRFLNRHQITTKRTEPVIGELETSWFTVSPTAPASEQGRLRQVLAAADIGEAVAVATEESQADQTKKDQYSLYRIVFKVEQAVKQGFSEVHPKIVKTNVTNSLEGPPDIKDAIPVTIAQQVAFLKVLAGDLLQTSASISVSLLAASINTEPKAEILNEKGQPTLLIYLDQKRFFATVKKSLANAEIDFVAQGEAEETTDVYVIELDRELLTSSQGKLPKGLKGRFHALELWLSWDNDKGRVFVKSQGKEILPPWYAEQVLTLIREFSV